MDEWISKKELLEVTGISYGQLYRWKRERLIPESWFEKRSSYTGQETFLPRERALTRIRFILDNKDRYSLTQLLERLNPAPAARTYTRKALASLVGEELLREAALTEERPNHGQALCLLVAADMAAGNRASAGVCLRALLAWQRDFGLMNATDGTLVLLDTGETGLPLYLTPESRLVPPPGAGVLFQVVMSDVSANYTRRLNDIFEEEEK